MRSLIVCLVVAAVAAVTAPAASAARLFYANFKVTVSGTQTSQVNGAEECQDAAGTVAPATAQLTFNFSTPKSKAMEFARFARGELVVTHPGRGLGNTKIKGTGTLTRQSQFVPNGSDPPVCPGGQQSAGCGAKTLSSFTILVQGGINEVTIQGSQPRPSPGLCLVPAPFPGPDLLGPSDEGDGAHITYKAKVPQSLLNPRKHVVLIHGSGTATNKGQQGAIHVTSSSTTLKFTMRLVRIPFH
jgi:hypothetical protein